MPPARRSEAAGAALAALRPAWVTVDLDALARNLAALSARIAPARRLAVVKADAYGHGAVEVSRRLVAEGVEWLAVALVEEGAELRRAGIAASILVFGTVQPSQVAAMRRYDLTPTVSSLAQLALWEEASAAAGRPQAIHLKVDTGMTRLGVALADLGLALERLRRAPGLELSGLMSHFADADDLASARNAEQETRFDEVVAQLSGVERQRVLVHMANSGAALHRPPRGHDLVRLGLSLWGLDPAQAGAALEPIASLSARIVQLQEVPAGTRVGYGGRWQAGRPSRIAVVPVGYADGYPWQLANKAQALAGGRRVAVAGAVSMDMLALDVTDAPVALGDEVVLLGRQGSETIDAHELAAVAGTIAYDILCGLALRLPRRYAAGGEWVACRSRLLGSDR